MKVILLENVKRIGSIGEVIEVKRFDLDSNYFSGKDEIDKKESYKN